MIIFLCWFPKSTSKSTLPTSTRISLLSSRILYSNSPWLVNQLNFWSLRPIVQLKIIIIIQFFIAVVIVRPAGPPPGPQQGTNVRPATSLFGPRAVLATFFFERLILILYFWERRLIAIVFVDLLVDLASHPPSRD